MLKFIVIFSVFCIIVWALDLLLRKSLKIPKDKDYRFVNSTHKKIEISMILIFLFVLVFSNYKFPLAIILLISFVFIRAFIEWKYDKNRREYIITLISIFTYPTFISIAYYVSFN
ncbi:DUF4181 domain-containing protein [Rummeliibacillus stabekisii]|uniref:DUF4181 domain-containing protein n=1 Tax=Rummeliibacillus stabekisii TaxID=241244 RepID=A0A143H8D1_9BACL|nr:DUF4181 domain-containing protein [Rummeliibacillus stabekisii]AMW97993.1 hypothetical protein ATY39_00330 [Rummeliibacillus stabekisii]